MRSEQVPEGQWDGVRQAILQMCATSSRSSKPAIYGGQILGDTVGLRGPLNQGPPQNLALLRWDELLSWTNCTVAVLMLVLTGTRAWCLSTAIQAAGYCLRSRLIVSHVGPGCRSEIVCFLARS